MERKGAMSYQAYLRLEGIAGQCPDPAHRDWMTIDSFNQNVCGPQERGGRTSMSDFAIARLADRATPQLARAAADGRHFKEAVLELCAWDGANAKFMEIRMTNVRISSYGLSGSPQNDARTPYENMMLAFDKIEWIYFPNAFSESPEKESGVTRTAWSADSKPAA
jgi:type VI secretion system secreted protein Hcp